MALIDGLISYWKMDESSGNALDAHGSNELTDTNTVGSNTGKINGARDFVPGSSEHFTRADNADLSFGDDALTFNCWVYTDDTSTNRTVLGKWASDGAVETCEYALRLLSDTLNWRVGDGTSNTNKSHSTPIGTGGWHMVTVNHDPSGNTIGIALDGGSLETTSHSTGLLDGAANFSIGRLGSFDGQYWDGRIDEVGLWSRVLSASEITELYNSGNGKPYSEFGGASFDAATFAHRLAVLPPQRKREVVAY